MIYNIFTFFIASIFFQKSETSVVVNEPDGNLIFIIVGALTLGLLYFLIDYRNTKKHRSIFNRNNEIAIKLLKNRKKGECKIDIQNKSNKFIEISAPLIILKGLSNSKKVKTKSNTYPLTISPGTNHSFSFKKNQLLRSSQKILNWSIIRVIINTNINKNYKSRYWIL
jgi:hypothetical protein